MFLPSSNGIKEQEVALKILSKSTVLKQLRIEKLLGRPHAAELISPKLSFAVLWSAWKIGAANTKVRKGHFPERESPPSHFFVFLIDQIFKRRTALWIVSVRANTWLTD
jgi:hypothetical protein